ncbi:MAG: hypothetical protein R3249_07940 [Nitriliruptorales bacterium]|nr:hypothetical protein [Nitriliruptorales bacterium]
MTALIGLVAVVVGGTDAFLLAYAGDADEVALEDVIADFRSEASPDSSDSPRPASPSDATDAPFGSPSAVPSPTANATEAPTGSPTMAPTPRPSASPTNTGLRRPVPGVYVYATEGGESVSLPGGSREYPSETFGVVRHLDGCGWTMERKILEQHEEKSTYCSMGSQLLQSRYETTIEFFGAREKEILVCDPPVIQGDLEAPSGSTRTGSCDGETVHSEGTATFHELTTLTIGGQEVRAMHVTIEGVSSGEATGTSRMELWAHAETGLPLKLIRWSESKTNRFGAGVTYTESVTFTLTSLSPQG